MKKISTFFWILFLMLILYSRHSFAKGQLEIIGEEDIAGILTGEGVTISNVKITGENPQIASFTGANYVRGFGNMNDGIMLTTGKARAIFARANVFLSTAWENHGDKDLDKIAIRGSETYDAVAIEFDAVSSSDKISFQYIFASEEFDQDKMFNDIFALYVNGENIAKMPNQKDTISMESLRKKNPQYYYQNHDGKDLAFLGYSTLLGCQANVTPGEVNKFKIVIADVGDPYFDSAIFIKANSISNKEAIENEENTDPPMPSEFDRSEPLVEIKKEVSAVELTTADGRVLHSITLENGQSLEELKQAFIINRSDIYLILDNELMQGATIKIEYKIKVKNKSVVPCIDLVIDDYLDNDLVCMSEGWNVKDNHLQLHLSGDLQEPVIKSEEEFETILVASRQLTSKNDKFEFQNKAKATVVNRGIELSTEEVTSQSVNIIPPFGLVKPINIIKIVSILGVMGIGVWILLGKVRKNK